jgi:hypothetical protein
MTKIRLAFAFAGAASASAGSGEYLRPANETELLASLHSVTSDGAAFGGLKSRRRGLLAATEHVVNPDFATVHKELLKLKPSETAAKDLESHVSGAAAVRAKRSASSIGFPALCRVCAPTLLLLC